MSISVLLAYASALLAFALAVTLGWHQRRSLAHWSLVAGMVVLAIEGLFRGLVADSVSAPQAAYWENWRMTAACLLPGPWLCFSLTYARGGYHEYLRRARFSLLLAFLVPLAAAVFFRCQWLVSVNTTPSGAHVFGLGLSGFLLALACLLASVFVLMNFERTYRAAVGTMRWRIKLMILGLGLLFAARTYGWSEILATRSVGLPTEAISSAALLVACLLVIASLSRPGHFEVSVYPSHSVLTHSLTLGLAGVYLLIVGVLAKLMSVLGGENAFALKAFLVLVALVGLTALALSDRAKLYCRRFVGRHFQRPHYDYRKVWKAFIEGTARQMETTGLCAAVVKLVSEIFQALSVTVWLVDDKQANLTFGASSSLARVKAAELGLQSADAALVLAGLRANPDPVDIDEAKEVWAVLLRRLHPDEFRKGGNRVCVPMIAGEELLGAMTVGDRVGGVPYSVQDLDLLKAAGDQTAASLLNIRLSQKLFQAKQLEAFQAMSTFFVHDLKNTASTLSLMLQNLPRHFGNPAFREDALRGISKTVGHINDLIRRLSLLRQELVLKPVACDLNTVVREALAGVGLGAGAETDNVNIAAQPVRQWKLAGGASDNGHREETSGKGDAGRGAAAGAATSGGIQVVTKLGVVGKVAMDPAQMQTVITNLVLNAKDALRPGGRICVGTSRQNGWVVLSVADNGSGISPEFIERSLFRPFQTTKQRGIGIGMFQCKLIVEAHRGKIEVKSELGKGTEFRVLLPEGADSHKN